MGIAAPACRDVLHGCCASSIDSYMLFCRDIHTS